MQKRIIYNKKEIAYLKLYKIKYNYKILIFIILKLINII